MLRFLQCLPMTGRLSMDRQTDRRSTANAPPPGLGVSTDLASVAQVSRPCILADTALPPPVPAMLLNAKVLHCQCLQQSAVVCVLVIRCVPSLDTEDVVTHRISSFILSYDLVLNYFLCACFSEFDPKTFLFKFIFLTFLKKFV